MIDEGVVCDVELFSTDERTYGHWSESRLMPGFNVGPCNNFEDWMNGQGIPNADQIDNAVLFDGLADGMIE
jgi:hypothetical protein